MDYKKYLKVLIAVGALTIAYGAGHHFGAVQRPALPRLPLPAALHRQLHPESGCNCCKTAKHKKHNAKPKTAKHKKHKEKAGKAHQDAPPSAK